MRKPTDLNDVKLFQSRLKEARVTQGISLDKLAEKSGLAKTTIINVENIKHLPYLHTAIALAKALNVSLDWLCGLDGQ